MGVIYKLLKHRKSLSMDLSIKKDLGAIFKRQTNDAETQTMPMTALVRQVTANDNDMIPEQMCNSESNNNNNTNNNNYNNYNDNTVKLCSELAGAIDQGQVLQHDEHNGLQQQETDEQQMTAEYVTQLCYFLAENARKKRLQNAIRNAAEQQQQQQQPQQQAQNQRHELIEAPLVLKDCDNIMHQKYYKQQEQQGQQQQQQRSQQRDNKRDILLKIRHQIFERKRQRQVAHMQQQLVVWRPW